MPLKKVDPLKKLMCLKISALKRMSRSPLSDLIKNIN